MSWLSGMFIGMGLGAFVLALIEFAIHDAHQRTSARTLVERRVKHLTTHTRGGRS